MAMAMAMAMVMVMVMVMVTDLESEIKHLRDHIIDSSMSAKLLQHLQHFITFK